MPPILVHRYLETVVIATIKDLKAETHIHLQRKLYFEVGECKAINKSRIELLELQDFTTRCVSNTLLLHIYPIAVFP